MRRKRNTLVLFATLAALAAPGCNSPEAVSRFCGSAQVTLAAAVPVFRDLEGSCLRNEALENSLGSFQVVEPGAGCAAMASQSANVVVAVQVLAAYFQALNALASFGDAKVGSSAAGLAARSAGALGADTAAQTALGSMASFLTVAATRGYQARSLNRDLGEVSGNVRAVTDALVQILEENYLKQELGREEHDLAAYYKEFAQTHKEGLVVVQLDERWHADGRELAARRRSAQELILALQTIKAGTADLAAHGKALKARQLPGLLQPYIDQLQIMVPQIQKAF